MEIKRFYQNQDSLAQIEEPYCGALKIMVDFYIEAPQDCNILHLNSFIEYSVISAVKTICEGLEKAGPNFPTALLRYKGGVLVTSYANNMNFGNFHVNKTWEAAVIFGCVYYVLANNTKISQKHLNYIEKVFSTDNESKQYFNKFKEPADQKRKELIANNPSEQVENHVLPAAKVEPSKVTALTNVIEELKRQLAEQKADNQRQQNEIAALAAQHQTIDTEIDKDVRDHEEAFYNKVCFEFFIRLMERAGLDLNNTGNKSRIGALWHKVTGKSADDLRRYCSKRNYQNNHTREDIKALNELLSDMKFEMQL